MRNFLLTLFFFFGIYRPFGSFYGAPVTTYYYQYEAVPVQMVYTVPVYTVPAYAVPAVEVQAVETQATTQPAPEVKQADPCPNGKCRLKVNLLNRSRF